MQNAPNHEILRSNTRVINASTRRIINETNAEATRRITNDKIKEEKVKNARWIIFKKRMTRKEKNERNEDRKMKNRKQKKQN